MSDVVQINLFEYLEEIKDSEQEVKAAIRAEWTFAQVWKSRFKGMFARSMEVLSLFLTRLPFLFGLIQVVNVYTITRGFGGSEAGGWYYRKYSCVKSILAFRWDTDVLQRKMQLHYQCYQWGSLTDSWGQDVKVCIEDTKATRHMTCVPSLEDAELIILNKQ